MGSPFRTSGAMRQVDRGEAPSRGVVSRPRAFEGSRPTPVRGPQPTPVFRPVNPVLGSFKKGGKVKKTGVYKLHKGEKVMPLSSLSGKCKD